jgi:hypothetical protein
MLRFVTLLYDERGDREAADVAFHKKQWWTSITANNDELFELPLAA